MADHVHITDRRRASSPLLNPEETPPQRRDAGSGPSNFGSSGALDLNVWWIDVLALTVVFLSGALGGLSAALLIGGGAL